MDLKYSVNHAVKLSCCHLSFVVPFTEHRQSSVSIFLKGSEIFRMVSEQTSAALTHSKSQSLLSFDALKPRIDISLVIQVLDSIFFQ